MGFRIETFIFWGFSIAINIYQRSYCLRRRRGSPKQQPAAVMASRVGLLLALGATR
jgi:hypothetical protein